MTSIQNFAKENIGILMSVLDSIWSIVKGNMSVILTVFTELFYIVLMSGSAVLNFVLSTVCNMFLQSFIFQKEKIRAIRICHFRLCSLQLYFTYSVPAVKLINLSNWQQCLVPLVATGNYPTSEIWLCMLLCNILNLIKIFIFNKHAACRRVS